MNARIRVLYAEDNGFDADLTKAYFAEQAPDFELDVVNSGRQCLELLVDGAYDVLLLDNHLPDIDGTTVLRELAAREIPVPVVMVTGVGDEALVVQVLRLGACDYVTKGGHYLAALPVVLRNAVNDHRQVGEAGSPGSLRPRRVLYVEYNAADIDLTLRHFAEAAPQFSLELVRSSKAALIRLGERPFDLVMTDLRLPDMNALDCLSEARRRDIDVPFVIITGGGDEASAIAALKLGAYDYIVKRDGYLTQLPYALDNAYARFQLAQLNRRLHTELVQKDQFLAMLAHELRNPLAPMRTALELLQRFGGQRDLVERAHDVLGRQIRHMARLLDDLLDVSRITSGRITIELEDLDLRALVGEGIESTRSLIEARGHDLVTTMPDHALPIRGDNTRLVQVFVNLLNNAAKYTDERGSIRVTVAAEGEEAVVRVVDTGVGISSQLLPRVFDLFTQDERALDRAQGGLGLGLTLVRRIAELHGGGVEAHSEGRGCGSEFVVRLPLHMAAMAALASTPPVSPAPARRNLKCLVVDDNVDAARMLECALTLAGHDVRLAFDGRDAVDGAAAFQPDAVVLDIGLPRMNGYEAARAIRQLPGCADVLIIAATGYGHDADYERSRDAGFDQHLVKPIDLDALLQALEADRLA
jgi:signal transduction histidine kinase